MNVRVSFIHRDFDNPEAETCWLSCLFQTLWHSVIFHTVFDEHLASSKHRVSDDEKILFALQQTWEDYRSEGSVPQTPVLGPTMLAEDDDDATRVVGGGSLPVSPGDLAEAFGEGYGDMSEALALMVDELSKSEIAAAKRLAEQIITVPVMRSKGRLPEPRDAWTIVEEWGASASSLIAVDLSLPRPPQEGLSTFCRLWVAACGTAAADLGKEHRLVSLVCFLHGFQHYVAFCRRRSSPTQCIFFNDLPHLTRGAEKVLTWEEVPEACAKFGLTPRLALYEAEPVRAE